MGVLVVTGVIGLLGILVKASIDSGSRATRWRRAISEDLELLAKYRVAMPDASATWDLEERIDREMILYAWLGEPAPSKRESESGESAKGSIFAGIAERLALVLAVGGAGFSVAALLESARFDPVAVRLDERVDRDSHADRRHHYGDPRLLGLRQQARARSPSCES
ncbi:hypothetical protein [Nocardioides sp. B-3]|uniref:hypothetical protein n=1 Tax=Nocardioides sp. B-3 TaxID=2895565 RepID=UPI0021523588|nr:hypothetical protein [Nocardioides sp. B-3]UUZ59463.1 hypothetical protein LP418_27400 [Nocardioides sp. B-3]